MRIVIGIVAFALLTTSAFAADMPMSAPATAAPIQAVNWTGFYIGGNAGGVIAHPVGTSDFNEPTRILFRIYICAGGRAACKGRFCRRRARRG